MSDTYLNKITWSIVTNDKGQKGVKITENGKSYTVFDNDKVPDGQISSTEISKQLGNKFQNMKDKTLSLFQKIQGKSFEDIEELLSEENTGDSTLEGEIENRKNRVNSERAIRSYLLRFRNEIVRQQNDYNEYKSFLQYNSQMNNMGQMNNSLFGGFGMNSLFGGFGMNPLFGGMNFGNPFFNFGQMFGSGFGLFNRSPQTGINPQDQANLSAYANVINTNVDNFRNELTKYGITEQELFEGKGKLSFDVTHEYSISREETEPETQPEPKSAVTKVETTERKTDSKTDAKTDSKTVESKDNNGTTKVEPQEQETTPEAQTVYVHLVEPENENKQTQIYVTTGKDGYVTFGNAEPKEQESPAPAADEIKPCPEIGDSPDNAVNPDVKDEPGQAETPATDAPKLASEQSRQNKSELKPGQISDVIEEQVDGNTVKYRRYMVKSDDNLESIVKKYYSNDIEKGKKLNHIVKFVAEYNGLVDENKILADKELMLPNLPNNEENNTDNQNQVSPAENKTEAPKVQSTGTSSANGVTTDKKEDAAESSFDIDNYIQELAKSDKSNAEICTMKYSSDLRQKVMDLYGVTNEEDVSKVIKFIRKYNNIAEDSKIGYNDELYFPAKPSFDNRDEDAISTRDHLKWPHRTCRDDAKLTEMVKTAYGLTDETKITQAIEYIKIYNKDEFKGTVSLPAKLPDSIFKKVQKTSNN